MVESVEGKFLVRGPKSLDEHRAEFENIWKQKIVTVRGKVEGENRLTFDQRVYFLGKLEPLARIHLAMSKLQPGRWFGKNFGSRIRRETSAETLSKISGSSRRRAA